MRPCGIREHDVVMEDMLANALKSQKPTANGIFMPSTTIEAIVDSALKRQKLPSKTIAMPGGLFKSPKAPPPYRLSRYAVRRPFVPLPTTPSGVRRVGSGEGSLSLAPSASPSLSVRRGAVLAPALRGLSPEGFLGMEPGDFFAALEPAPACEEMIWQTWTEREDDFDISQESRHAVSPTSASRSRHASELDLSQEFERVSLSPLNGDANPSQLGRAVSGSSSHSVIRVDVDELLCSEQDDAEQKEADASADTKERIPQSCSPATISFGEFVLPEIERPKAKVRPAARIEPVGSQKHLPQRQTSPDSPNYIAGQRVVTPVSFDSEAVGRPVSPQSSFNALQKLAQPDFVPEETVDSEVSQHSDDERRAEDIKYLKNSKYLGSNTASDDSDYDSDKVDDDDYKGWRRQMLGNRTATSAREEAQAKADSKHKYRETRSTLLVKAFNQRELNAFRSRAKTATLLTDVHPSALMFRRGMPALKSRPVCPSVLPVSRSSLQEYRSLKPLPDGDHGFCVMGDTLKPPLESRGLPRNARSPLSQRSQRQGSRSRAPKPGELHDSYTQAFSIRPCSTNPNPSRPNSAMDFEPPYPDSDIEGSERSPTNARIEEEVAAASDAPLPARVLETIRSTMEPLAIVGRPRLIEKTGQSNMSPATPVTPISPATPVKENHAVVQRYMAGAASEASGAFESRSPSMSDGSEPLHEDPQ